jgi:hypothetical protein
VVSFIDGGNRSTRKKPLTCRKSLTNFITYCCIEYTSPWMGFELTTWRHFINSTVNINEDVRALCINDQILSILRLFIDFTIIIIIEVLLRGNNDIISQIGLSMGTFIVRASCIWCWNVKGKAWGSTRLKLVCGKYYIHKYTFQVIQNSNIKGKFWFFYGL